MSAIQEPYSGSVIPVPETTEVFEKGVTFKVRGESYAQGIFDVYAHHSRVRWKTLINEYGQSINWHEITLPDLAKCEAESELAWISSMFPNARIHLKE